MPLNKETQPNHYGGREAAQKIREVEWAGTIPQNWIKGSNLSLKTKPSQQLMS